MIDSANLSHKFFLWWEQQFRKVKMSDDDLTRDKKRIKIIYEGVREILEFDGDGSEIFLNVYVLNGNSSLKDSIASALKKKRDLMEKKTRREYGNIFGDSSVSLDNVVYFGEKFDAVKISTRVKNIPLGKERGLSEKLFDYARREIVGVVHNAARGII